MMYPRSRCTAESAIKRPRSQPCEHKRKGPLVGLARCNTPRYHTSRHANSSNAKQCRMVADHRRAGPHGAACCSDLPCLPHPPKALNNHNGRLTTATYKKQPCFCLIEHIFRRPLSSPSHQHTLGPQAPRRPGASAGGKLISSMPHIVNPSPSQEAALARLASGVEPRRPMPPPPL